jgi:hypothetical protein
MLSEIFMLRMEAVWRESKETAFENYSRFVPITLADFNSELPSEGECSKVRGRPFLDAV